MTREDGLIASHVTDVAVTAESLAVATPAGITFIDAAGPRSLYAFHGLVNNHVYTLAAAGQRLFAGTLGGMSVLDAGVVEASYTTANSPLRQNWITAIVPFGDEWFVGTYGAGLFRLNALGTWNTFPEASAAFEVNPNAMVSSSERVYAGTLGRGLWVYQRNTGRWTELTAGLPSHNVTALALADGYVYVGTDNGLVRIREAQLIEP
jgi:ligand-binding sensor domain-containing protein